MADNKLFVLLVALAAISAMALAAPDVPDCSKLDEVMDDLGSAQGLTVLNDKYKLASTTDEYEKRCQEMSDAIKMMKKYNSKCHKSLTQQVVSAILSSRNEMNEAHCNKETDLSKETFKAIKCIVDDSMESVKEAERKILLNAQVLFDSNVADEKVRLRRACCDVQTGKELFLNATKEKCAKYEKIYSDYVDSYTKEAMSLICPTELKCGELERLKMEGAEPKSKFFLSPMVKIIRTLDH